MTTITLTLSDAEVEQAKKQGLTSKKELAEFARKLIRDQLDKTTAPKGGDNLPPGFDPRLKGIVDPELYGTVTILGDIIEPIDVEWEASS